MPIKDLNLWGAPNVPMGHLKSPRGASIHLHVHGGYTIPTHISAQRQNVEGSYCRAVVASH